MKKLSILLILALALTALPAFAAQGDVLLGRTENDYTYFNYGFSVGDTLYMASGATLYTCRVGDADMEEHAINLPAREMESYSDDLLPFSEGDAVYAIDLLTSGGEHTAFEGAELLRLTLGDDGAFATEKVTDVDWSDLVEYYDEESYATRPDCIIGTAGKAFMRVYDSTGDYTVVAIDLATGQMTGADALRGCFSMTRYREGMLLAQMYSYDQPDKARLVSYDPADDSAQTLAEVTVAEYSPMSGLAYDEATDTIYCVKAGEVCPVDLQAGEIGAGVTDMPMESYGSSGCVLTGSYYALCSEGAVIRNLDPGQRAEVRLKINDSGWTESVNNTYYRFANAHGDVSTVLSRDWTESQNLLENMMNRDDSIDIYVLSTNSSIYDALYKRGYLMELDGSEKLADFASRVYPDIREAISANGHLVSLPVEFSCWTLGVNEKALEKLGMTLADVPDNWSDFLDFLVSLEEPLKDGRMHLFYAGYTSQDARNDLFNSIFNDYQRYVNAVDPAMGFNTELLRGLLTKLENIDFVALGLPEPEEDDDGARMSVSFEEYGEDSVLMQTDVGCTIGNFYSTYTPMLMGLDADTPMPLVLRTEVAVVNPYTKHPEQALAFMEELVDSLSTATRYCAEPDLNEVIRGKQNEENLADAQKWLEEAQAELEEAEPSERQAMEENVANAQENVNYWETYGWEVSQRELDWYRGHDDHIVLEGVEWLYADDSGEAWELINQYMERRISIDEMLSGIDRKVQMMLLEGN